MNELPRNSNKHWNNSIIFKYVVNVIMQITLTHSQILMVLNITKYLGDLNQ